MAEGNGGSGGGGGTAVIVVLAVCAAAGMASGVGRDGRVQAAGTGGSDQPGYVSVDNASSFDGTLHVSTSACDQVGATQVRYEAFDEVGGRLASVTRDVEPADRRQRVAIGRGLPEGDYRVTVTCLAQGEPVGDFRTMSTRVVPARDGAQQGSGDSGEPAPATYPLPATGR